MFFFMPAMWSAPRENAGSAATRHWDKGAPKSAAGNRNAARKERLSALLDKIAPEFMVTATRSALLAMTTSLTKVSTRVHGICQQMNQALAFDRMMRSVFPWAMPAHDPFDISGMDSWFTGGGRRSRSVAVSPFSFAPAFWWAAFSVPAAAAASAPILGLFAAMAPVYGLGRGLEANPFWGAFFA
jgi:hypothetical protein